MSNANAARPGLVDDVTAKTGVVDDLRNRLLQAERALADAKIRLADLDNLRLQLPVRISTLRQELDELNARARACSEQAARIQDLINGLKGDKYPEITRQITDLDGKISASRTRVT